jgi:hypothetical protein
MSELPLRHKIGSARTIRTAVLVCEFLRSHCCFPHSSVHCDRVKYVFEDPTPENGFWSADIIVEAPVNWDSKESARFVEVCRAFVAGAGEIW